MKLFHLIVHQKTFSEEDLLINPKDYQEAKEGDIVEIFHPSEDDNPRLLLQIKAFKDDLSSKDTISIEQSIAAAFGLRNYKDISMRIVNPADVALDSIELTFKDQYMGRSEMWRLKNSLINTCVYMNKKIEFCGGAVRCQVYEMWSQGDRVACGVITDDTKVVFRSSTSMVYLFLQMSSEMWDFNIYGDLYFEKAVNGFLSDLFMKWKKNGSNHEVTIVLFSRTFYKASSLEEFPLHMRECLQKDYKGRYYEDFYRVAVQNERYEDWSGILVQLRRLFSQYLKIVLEYHSRDGEIIPAATNSTAAQGNFLEVLNMSLNVFEKHYLDRSFDRTGQLSVVITPGVGVFEVDRELTNITKQRIIDNGVGSDLVCVGEQPLHAVPLLKFHNKDTHLNVPDDYSMPHWINLSFYSTNKKVAYSNFIPRIKLPPSLIDNTSERCIQSVKTNLMAEEDYLHNSFFDYDAYDAQVFQIPAVPQVHEVGIHKTTPRYKRGSGGLLDSHELCKPRRKLSDPDIQHVPKTDNTPRSQPIVIPSAAVSPIVSPLNDTTLERDLSPPLRMVIGSEGSPPLESRALINPFDPSHVTIKLTSNRRRWTHIFPKGPTGVLIQQHHYQAVPAKQYILTDNNTSTISFEQKQNNSSYQAKNASLNALIEYCKKEKPVGHTSGRRRVPLPPKNISKTFLWGATGEQEWTPAITTVNEVIIGVDWKSLTIPACLPITTDYFPDKRALQIDYVVSLYNLLPDDVNAESQQKTNYKKPLTTIEVFQELISQRLAQGFQLILMPSTKQCSTSSVLRKNISDGESTYSLSIGRLFHKITLSGNAITVTRYRPRHPYPGFNYQYRYRFHTPHHDTYEESYASFTTEKLEHYNWNYLDHYICTRGDTDFSLVDALKYWRFRVYLLPLNNAATKRIIEGSHCDIYGPMTSADHQQMVEGFLKFIESVVNRIRRTNAKKPRMSLSVINHNTPLVQPRRNSMSAVNQSGAALLGADTSIAGISTASIESITRMVAGKMVDLAPELLNVSRSSRIMSKCPTDPITCLQLLLLKLTQSSTSSNSPFRERLGSNRLPDRPRPRSGSKVMEKGRASPAIEILQQHLNDAQSQDSGNDDNVISDPLLRPNASSTEILEAMKQPINGLGLLPTHQSLPQYTFISSDAINWLITHMEGVTTTEKAIKIFTTMQRDKLICHASGDITKPFVQGFFLYYIVYQNDKERIQQSCDLTTFQNDWMEVEVKEPLNCSTSNSPSVPSHANTDPEDGVPHFLRDEINPYSQVDEFSESTFRRMLFDIDSTNKSDRVEWGHVRYQTTFRPDQAYELVVEWLIASGSIVSELLHQWARKVQAYGLQMVPIPNDPLALPYSDKSDPLRGPIFVPLNIDCLDPNNILFKEFRGDTYTERLFLLQEAILYRFGFIPCLTEAPSKEATSQEYQYIHCTGTVFILISSPISKNRNKYFSEYHKQPGSKYTHHADIVPSPHEAYITRHVSGKNKNNYDKTRKMGFLWSWNYMISKRWRTNQVDTNFQLKLLKDFREFCSNVDNRLKIFWNESWELKNNINTKNHFRNE